MPAAAILLAMSETGHEVEEDVQEQAEIGKAVTWGFLIGVPVTFFAFLGIVLATGANLQGSIVIAVWVALIGGGFYGGIAGLLRVLNRHGH